MPLAAPLNGNVRLSRSDRGEAECRRLRVEEEAERRSRLKRAKSNPVLQRSARSEVLHLEPVRLARPLNTALDRREVVEVKRSAIDVESKRPGGVG
jgi:hypothetical protein